MKNTLKIVGVILFSSFIYLSCGQKNDLEMKRAIDKALRENGVDVKKRCKTCGKEFQSSMGYNYRISNYNEYGYPNEITTYQLKNGKLCSRYCSLAKCSYSQDCKHIAE